MSEAGWQWPWRRTTLWRTSDVVEAWLRVLTVLVLTVAVPVAGVVTGFVLYGTMRTVAAHEAGQRHQTAAVVEPQPRSAAVNPPSPSGGRVPARLAWTGADGSRHTQEIPPVGRGRLGSTAPVWTDAGGWLVSAPITDDQVRGRAVAGGAAGAAVTAGGYLATVYLVLRRMDRKRLDDWQREWAEIGPRWSRSG